MKRLFQFAVAAAMDRGLHGPKAAAAVDLSGAWATSADECSNVFVRKGRAKQIEFTALSDQNGGGFIVEVDRLRGKFGDSQILRYVPAEHYWPEHSFKMAASLQEELQTTWKADRPRPLHLLKKPECIEVTAPIPDYPPMLFRYKGRLHKVIKADACERIESEWWLDGGLHRDYYIVEDEEGMRYWLFRLGHYNSDNKPSWFIHGFFA